MSILDTVKKEKNKIIVDSDGQSDNNGIKRGVFEATLARLRRENLDFFEQRGWDERYFLDTDASEFEMCLYYIEEEIKRG